MAILKHGINGPFSGKVGNVVGYELNGQHVIRSLPTPKKRKPTELVLINRLRMAAVSQFLAPLKQVIAFGYKHAAPAGSRVGAFQTAQSHLFKNAIAYGEQGIPYINPEAVQLFCGDLQQPHYLEAVREDGDVRLSWDITSHQLPEAVLVLVAYNPEHGVVIFDKGGTKANKGIYDWEIPESIWTTCDHLHIYAGFYNITQDQLSDSVYVGCV